YTNYVFINFYNNWEKYITNNLKKIFENNKDFYNFEIISENDNSKKEKILANEIKSEKYKFIFTGKEWKKNFNYVGLTEEKIKYFSSGTQKIKLGILDDGKISLDPDLFNINLITNKNRILPFNNNFGEHATNVASVAGGYNGVNKNINLYGIRAFFWNGIEQEIEWLISNNVKVINVSLGYGDYYKYNGYANYFDKLSNNLENEVTFVIAAGNDGRKEDLNLRKLQQLQLSYNSVTVGASDAINYFETAAYSSYGSLNDAKEVTLIAPPGIFDKYNVYDKKTNNYSGVYYNGGTSFSSPVVASVLASYMNKKSYIYDKGLDSIISLSALSSSATHSDTINSKMGAGLLNVDNFESALESLNYIKLKGDSYVAENQENITTHKVYLKKGQKLKAALAWNFKNEFDKEWP
uniref:S8 family serine peptidase n=1 Tax=[Mycoplasma] collis TaxID=2127 RepID=UPI00051B1201